VTPPDVRVVRGEPDDAELAALVAGLAAGRSSGHEVVATEVARREETARRRWRDAAQRLTDPLTPGADAWRWSARG
jgi:hypothetical protein